MHHSLLKGICKHLEKASNPTVLWLSSSDTDIPDHIQVEYHPPDSDILHTEGADPHDFAVLADLGHRLSRSNAEALLARMRDVHARRVFWVVSTDEPWLQNDVLALGFRMLASADSESLYGFDIKNYKTTPDWLNARHWANPDRWGKERW